MSDVQALEAKHALDPHAHHWTSIWIPPLLRKPNLRGIAIYCPLIAAIFAPLSTLLDIPALTQHWYTLDGISQSDPTASLVLSAVGLFLNILANSLLLLRFTSHTRKWWQLFTTLSLVSWIGKTTVAVVNLIVFGILTRNASGYSYSEGFWCAVISVIDSGMISTALLLHYTLSFRRDDGREVRMEGRKFMLSVTFFIGILAIQALAFCRIEKWAYSDAIYFSVQTALTIGFGDFTPTTTAGKVLVFVFSILTISQLGNEIAIIIAFISTRAKDRRDRWRRKYEGAMHREANKLKPNAGLMEEMALIHEINQREEIMSQVYDLMWSALSLVIFWIAGAAIFSSIEEWTYGNALYMVMVLSLTIGFGDYSPVQPAGKVVFIVYALMAVPIVTSFAVQTITGLLSTFSERRSLIDQFRREKRDSPEVFEPHADFVLRARESYRDMRGRLLGDTAELNQAEARVRREYDAAESIVRRRTDGSESEERELEEDLVKQLLDLVIKFEVESRDLLLDSMATSIARTLLLADRNVQIRDVKALRGDNTDLLKMWRGIEREQDEDKDQLARVKRYRNTFAEILVIGSILQKLQGEEQNKFERWGKARDSDDGDELKQIAQREFDGITGLILRRHLKKLGSKA